MTGIEKELERESIKAAKKYAPFLSFAKPYMRESDPGFDAPTTNHYFQGYCIGFMAAEETAKKNAKKRPERRYDKRTSVGTITAQRRPL